MPESKPEILADHVPHRLHAPGRLWLGVGLVATLSLSVVAATAVVPSQGSTIKQELIREILEAPAATIVPLTDEPFVQDDRVRRGDTLSNIFERLGIDDPEAERFMNTSEQGRRALSQLRAGKRLSASVTPQGRLVSLSLPLTGGAGQVTIERDANGFSVGDGAQEPFSSMVEMRSGTIRHSLFGATEAVGLPDAVATRLADLFGTEIDFHSDLRKGDRFAVVYETLLGEDGRTKGVGRILAAEFVNKGRRHSVVLYRDKDGREDYYTEDGRSLKQAFLRSPLAFTRITSGFSRRFHPILKKWRQHKGVDFGAPTGAAIKATSNGTVDFAGTQRGYGNVVILRHRDRITTLYAHMRGFASGIRKGKAVSQGDVIGYVGQSGWATGPHLHYEFRVSNVPKDPMSIALPTAKPLSPAERTRFMAQTTPYRSRLALLDYRLASQTTTKP